jgi:hypothetical protein
MGVQRDRRQFDWDVRLSGSPLLSDQGWVGTNITANVDAGNRILARLTFDQHRGPEIWSTNVGGGLGAVDSVLVPDGCRSSSGARGLVPPRSSGTGLVGTVGLSGATARPRCSIHAPGLDAVDGHFWQFQLFNVLGMALVVVSLVPLV